MRNERQAITVKPVQLANVCYVWYRAPPVGELDLFLLESSSFMSQETPFSPIQLMKWTIYRHC